jgi:hypothetical protein
MALAQGTLTAIAFAPSGYPIPLRKKPDADSKLVVALESVDTVILINYVGGSYYRVASQKAPSKEGFLYIEFLRFDKDAVQIINKVNVDAGEQVRLKYESLPKDYRSQTTKSYYRKSYSSGSSRTIHTGPRGGRYYINKNGKKTYIKKN